MARSNGLTVLIMATALATPLAPSWADDVTVSPARARAALAAGQIRPLLTLLTQIEARYDGEVIEAELREGAGHWEYEFELLPSNGRRFVVLVDAATGRVVRTRGPVLERR